MITGTAPAAWAKGSEQHKKLKCKMVCYLMPGRSVGTRCYRYAGNGLSHLGGADYRFIVLLLLLLKFLLSCPHAVTSVTQPRLLGTTRQPPKLLSFSPLHSTSHTNHHRSISPSTYPWIPELTSRLLTFTWRF